MDYNRDITEIMKERHSSRTYTDRSIESEKQKQLRSAMKELRTIDYRFALIDYKPEDGVKLGTYGMIKGASAFLVGIMSASLAGDKEAGLNFGYAFEHLILKATDIGLQTCWMAATFNSKDIRKFIQINVGENIVMVSPVGYEEKPRMMEKVTRFSAGSDKRRSWSELFYDAEVDVPLTRERAGDYAKILDLVRVGPSASNKQPWRMIMSEDGFDLYAGDSGYKEMKGQKISKTHNDIGIAKAHFELGAQHFKLVGQWVQKETLSDNGFEYVCSWALEEDISGGSTI